MHKRIAAALVVSCLTPLWSQTSTAGLLDRLKSKAEEVRSEARDARGDVDAVVNADETVEAEIDRAVPTEADVESRAAARIESTEEARAARGLEREANDVLNLDERAQASLDTETRSAEHELRAPEREARAAEAELRGAEGEVRAAEHEIQAATDVEGRARDELNRTDAAGAVRQGRRDAHDIATADEQVELELRRTRESVEGVLED